MDMSMPSNSAVANLPLSDPDCINAGDECTAFYAASNVSQDTISWAYQFEYGHWATYYYVIIIGLLFLAYLFTIIKDRLTKNSPTPPQSPSLLRKLQALGRFVFYRRIRASWPANLLDFPAGLGTILFLLVTIVFVTALVFAVKPYYRAQIGYGSPPLAIRCGLMAFACVPILVALAGKANIVTFFTGISHEKLNVLHRWVAWISFALSLFHGLPYFVGSVRNAISGGEAQVKLQFYIYGETGANEYTGVPPLAILFGICIASLPSIRNRFYESFYALHIVLVITYFGLLFWHSGNTMDSWAYLWATLAIWLVSWLNRVFWKTQPLSIRNSWFAAAPATIAVAPGVAGGAVTRIDVWPLAPFAWSPGQHAFLRFITIAPLDNHPFTIAIAAAPRLPPSVSAEQHKPRPHLVFIARAHASFTRKLAALASAENAKVTPASVWLDGPYGGLSRPLHARFDTLVLLAGGTGITACFPWLQDTVARAWEQQEASSASLRVKRAVLVWAVKRVDAVLWLGEELDALAERVGRTQGLAVEIRLHVTGEPVATSQHSAAELDANAKAVKEDAAVELDVNADTVKQDEQRGYVTLLDEKPLPTTPPSSTSPATALSRIAALGATVYTGRPVMPAVLKDIVRQGERTMVIGCGPNTFRADLGNAVAAAQTMVLKGEVVELAMHLETFGW